MRDWKEGVTREWTRWLERRWLGGGDGPDKRGRQRVVREMGEKQCHKNHFEVKFAGVGGL